MSELDGGTQVAKRTLQLLRVVGKAEPVGLTTTEASRQAGISRPTAHRLLTTLGDSGFLDRRRDDGRWTLGPEVYLLGIGAANRYDITDDARDVVDRLASDTGESAFLSVRRADETVCLYGQEGSFPLRSHVLRVGVRFPLGVASAGLAILSHLPDPEIESYLARVDLTGKWGKTHSYRKIRERVAETRETGFAVNPALIVEGSWGIGAAVFDRLDRPSWALSLTGVQTRFRADRRAEMGGMLLDAAHLLSMRLKDRRMYGGGRSRDVPATP